MLFRSPLFDCLITGVGQMQCAAHLAAHLATRQYDIAIQAGLAGSFSPHYAKRSVVIVEEEFLADLGAEANGSYLDIAEMGFLEPDEYPFSRGRLKASREWVPEGIDLPFVRSVTVNRVLSDPRSIAWVATK